MAKDGLSDRYSEKETAERRDATIKRMLATPPRPHSKMKIGKRKASRAKGTGARKAKVKAAE